MTGLDLAVIAAYLGAVVAVNRYWAGRVKFDDWLTSKNSISAAFLTFTVVSTNVGAGTIVGTVGKTMHAGIGWALTSGVGVLFGFWLMAALAAKLRRLTPAGDRSSFSEFFRRRYARPVRLAVGAVIAFLYFFYLAAQFRALGAILEVWAGFHAEAAGLAAAILVIWLTASAGIRSDLYTDALHFWAMVVTIAAAAAIEVAGLGGPAALFHRLSAEGKLAGLLDPFRFGGAAYVFVGIPVGMLLGLPAFENWQRVDAARSVEAVRIAFFVSGVLNLLFFAAAAFLGLVAAASLDPETPSNHALYVLVSRTLPPGLLGLAVAGVFAALMSTANSMLMVSVTALLGDLLFAERVRLSTTPGILATTRWLTWGVGAAALLLGMAWPDIVGLILKGLWGSGMLLPAIVGGFWWRRGTSAGALWSLLGGTGVTLVLSYVPGYEANSWIPGLAVATALYVGVSLATRHAPGEQPAPTP
jgi:SSS family solute:Na+ symporter